ncbi:C-terminal processing protease CtpA/Prc [Anseongella ginsenosidimutans]|uniref:C-terminal processing protease CtpA/Prc n=1 Tax=Anseongella ginsenosidimutans TaxID=496056 RepID=A0A4R3KUL2_9SPHI|nr:S41 family peptidase [Anseongella ginsenosidimutans]QEC51744.1 peptidase S41 [Anseongella ginsenosidimutans]TCS89107.1 C-terminal processing protease CtpA/Prc [Anseongella ginsenosidimutans]
MKRFFLFLLVNFFNLAVFAQTPRQIGNITTFAKLYGYVRYFHPSDEAAATDWEGFAVYGAEQVENASNATDLKKKLAKLFLPIAPSIRIYMAGEDVRFDKAEITPPDTAGYKAISWQHLGIGFGDERSIYKSSRINRLTISKSNRATFGNAGEMIEVSSYQGKEFILKARVKVVKGPGTGHLWARVDTDQGTGFFDNMMDRPVINGKEWATYEIKGKIDTNASKLAFGAFLLGTGNVLVDDLTLLIKEGETWATHYSNKYPKNEEKNLEKINEAQPGYHFSINEDAEDSNFYLSISDSPARARNGDSARLFEQHCQVGEYISKEIGSGLQCLVPLTLYGTEKSTYPVADKDGLEKLRNNLSSIVTASLSGDSLYTRLADLVITWNIFQHFYPYFEEAQTDWENDLRIAVKSAYTDKTDYDFLKTLQKFTAKLKDGHVRVSSPASIRERFMPPVEWEWVENKLIITGILQDSLPLQAGDIVTAINGSSPEAYFEEIQQYISAATKGWLDSRAQVSSLAGIENSTLNLKITKANGSMEDVGLLRSLSVRGYYAARSEETVSREISQGLYYLNIDAASDDDIKELMPKLKDADGIICDLRGYPKSSPELIAHLLSEKDTSSMWMRVPRIIYPDQEKIAGYKHFGWEMAPKKPHLDARIVFITDGSAISYAESYMSFIEHYKLATIVGQPTAGTNGNINPFRLPGGYHISWTGMKVFKHDGSRHHGVGIIPDVYVEKTIAGVREGRDEFLEKAIEIAKGK